MRSAITGAAFLFAALAASAGAEPTLVGFASLPPDTFRHGPTSGQFLEPDADLHGREAPFVDEQPVQGISSIVAGDEEGTFLALSDNGFGTKANSADYLLCVYRVTPSFITEEGGTGEVEWELAFHLSDPDKKVPWPIVAEGETYPDSDIPVPAQVREKRLLTGADFDPESMVRLPDGTFWMGDEFGPFLLHFDAEGKLLEVPVEPPEGFHSPDHPRRAPEEAAVPRSAGFEAMVIGIDPWNPVPILVPILEKPLPPEQRERFNHEARGNLMTRYFHTPFFGADVVMDEDARGLLTPMLYPLPTDAEALGEAARLPTRARDGYRLVVVERDGEEGDAATHKMLALATVGPNEFDEFETTRESLADLLNLADPHDLDGDGSDTFRFPFWTIESVLPVDYRTVLVVNDNNYPLSSGRTEGEPDPTEFILVRFDKPLADLP